MMVAFLVVGARSAEPEYKRQFKLRLDGVSP